MKLFSRLLMASALFMPVHHAASQIPFAVSAVLTNGTTIRSVTTMDVNNDGKPDMICVRATASFVYVWTNNGNGLLVSNTSYATGSHPNQVIAADVNNDGKLDLITANIGNSLTVLTNDANGGFALASTLPLPASTQPLSVAAGDLNGDGRPDLVSANSLLATFTEWTNSGGGIFVSNTSFSVGSPGFTVPQWVATADVNGDGKGDIIGVCNNSDIYYLHIWTNNGAGGFAPAPAPFPVSVSGYLCVVPTDVNGDGKVDLVLIASETSGTGVMVMLNNGAGGFGIAGFYPVGLTPYAVVPADVNGDGSVDFITPNQGNNTLTVLTNDGTGVLGSNTTVNVGSGPESAAAADLNGDGRMDLIAGNWNTGTLTVVTNAGTFLPRLTLKYSGNNVIVSWPAVWANWSLQENTGLAPDGWTGFGGGVGNDGTIKRATNSAPAGNLFFRLSNP